VHASVETVKDRAAFEAAVPKADELFDRPSGSNELHRTAALGKIGRARDDRGADEADARPSPETFRSLLEIPHLAPFVVTVALDLGLEGEFDCNAE